MIRLFEERDGNATWRILDPVFRAGASYVFSPDITEDETHGVWVATPLATFFDDEAYIAHSLPYLAALARLEAYRDGNTNTHPEK